MSNVLRNASRVCVRVCVCVCVLNQLLTQRPEPAGLSRYIYYAPDPKTEDRRIGVRSPVEARYLSHPTSFEMDTGTIPPEAKRPESETAHHLHLVLRSRMRGAIPPFLHSLHDVMLECEEFVLHVQTMRTERHDGAVCT
jgi:hypothetical protein